MIGNQLTPSQLNSQIGGIAVALRSTFDTLGNFVLWFNTLQLADIQAEFALDASAAVALQAGVGNLNTLLNIYKGTAVTLPLPFDFRTNSANMWGGT